MILGEQETRPRVVVRWRRGRVDDVKSDYERLSRRGVRFTQPPTEMGAVTTAVFDDTCGNLIQTAQRA